MFMYLGLFVHSVVVFHVFMFYVGLLIVLLCFMSDIVLFFIDCYRAMLCIRGTSHGPVSVCLSQVGVLLKWLNRGSHKQHHTIAQGL